VTLSTSDLEQMTQNQLDDVFRSSPAGDIPRGEGRGTVILDPATEITDIAAKVIHLIGWKGKVFDPDNGLLRNEILPIGIKAIVAKVYPSASWFDGKEAIILDYSQTSLVAHWIRDEIRLVAPGLYLGIVYWDKTKLINFALEFPQSSGAP
jgi:hypothetical protein